MPTVVREAGFEIRIYTADHRPPHVHVHKDGGQAKIEIANDTVLLTMVKGMSRRDADRAVGLVAKHYATLAEAWSKFYGKP